MLGIDFFRPEKKAQNNKPRLVRQKQPQIAAAAQRRSQETSSSSRPRRGILNA